MNSEALQIFKQGVSTWNRWRAENPGISVDLYGASFPGMDLYGVNFSDTILRAANFKKACLSKAVLRRADLQGANLERADLSGAYLQQAHLGWTEMVNANLSGAALVGSNLVEANLCGADLSGANLQGATLASTKLTAAKINQANLNYAILIKTDVQSADLTGCRAYGIAAWNLNLANAIQKNIIITEESEPTIQVDRLELAQFVYLLLNNAEVRYVIDTITSKVVLILGRFTDERKAILDGLRTALRERDYLPILFDWEKPSSRNITETVSTLAHMAKFVIADITDARSIPQELMAIVPRLPSVPVQPILLASQNEYGMFEDFRGYTTMLPLVFYESEGELLCSLQEKVIRPAEAKLKEIRAASAGVRV